MKHFWLDDAQQAIMDVATSTASDFGHIGLVDAPTRWQRPVRNLLGENVAPENHFRIHNITHDVNFGTYRNLYKLKSAIRLNGKQAMMLKLRVGGTGTSFVVNDPTGEHWGNIGIAATDRSLYDWHSPDYRSERYRRFTTWEAHTGFRNLISGRPFGATIASVGDCCKGLPANWARSLVWKHVTDSHRFAEVIEPREFEVVKRAGDQTPPEKMVICRDLLDVPLKTLGQAAARVFAMECQRINVRKQYGCDGDLGPIL